MAKTWAEKLASKNPAKTVVLEKAVMGLPAGSKLFIAHPLMVKAYIEAIPPGETRTIPQMRDDLARENGADSTCALTSGIFSRIVAEAALDELRAGKDLAMITPFWRLIEPNSPAAKKLSCDSDFIAGQRAAEARQAG